MTDIPDAKVLGAPVRPPAEGGRKVKHLSPPRVPGTGGTVPGRTGGDDLDERKLQRVLAFVVESGRDSIGLTRDDFSVAPASADGLFEKPKLDRALTELEHLKLVEMDRFGNEFLVRPTRLGQAKIREGGPLGPAPEESPPAPARETRPHARGASAPSPAPPATAPPESRVAERTVPPSAPETRPPGGHPVPAPAPATDREELLRHVRELQDRARRIKAKEDELSRRETDLSVRLRSIAEREGALEKREKETGERARATEEKAQALDARERELGRRETELQELLQKAKSTTANLAARQRELDDREEELENLMGEMGLQAKILEELERNLRTTQEGVRSSHEGLQKILATRRGDSSSGSQEQKDR